MTIEQAVSRPPKTCCNPHCPHFAEPSKKLCATCEQRKRRHGDPNTVKRRVKNTQCRADPDCPTPPRGTYCCMHARRLQRHQDAGYDATKSAQVRREARGRCINPWCAGKRSRKRDQCVRCLRARHRKLDPRKLRRKYRRLCAVSWCWHWSETKGLCFKHGARLKTHGSVLAISRDERETIPKTCTLPGCGAEICARGLCETHLLEKAKVILMLREYIPKEVRVPWHRTRRCIGRPDCKRRAVLFERCPDCLYDWQMTLTPPKRYLR
jgi:hypothetical protein